MGHGKKYKSKRQLKKDMPQNKLMEMGLIGIQRMEIK